MNMMIRQTCWWKMTKRRNCKIESMEIACMYYSGIEIAGIENDGKVQTRVENDRMLNAGKPIYNTSQHVLATH